MRFITAATTSKISYSDVAVERLTDGVIPPQDIPGDTI
jgi:hypothetical protein